eukprot:TRINITY_DN121608_c0_g1_i1.p1 TRINITY_DN121608_c0_g1~~TRINITY_DN121608_c0_g1_i1.p1  ORF type:complete len:351 (+),score=69.40 TRINITY_DN121608_c0_g1_i1:156-1208(+)
MTSISNLDVMPEYMGAEFSSERRRSIDARSLSKQLGSVVTSAYVNRDGDAPWWMLADGDWREEGDLMETFLGDLQLQELEGTCLKNARLSNFHKKAMRRLPPEVQETLFRSSDDIVTFIRARGHEVSKLSRRKTALQFMSNMSMTSGNAETTSDTEAPDLGSLGEGNEEDADRSDEAKNDSPRKDHRPPKLKLSKAQTTPLPGQDGRGRRSSRSAVEDPASPTPMSATKFAKARRSSAAKAVHALAKMKLSAGRGHDSPDPSRGSPNPEAGSPSPREPPNGAKRRVDFSSSEGGDLASRRSSVAEPLSPVRQVSTRRNSMDKSPLTTAGAQVLGGNKPKLAKAQTSALHG